MELPFEVVMKDFEKFVRTIKHVTDRIVFAIQNKAHPHIK
jgi:hypothetical protein